jgi:hypothetical protein
MPGLVPGIHAFSLLSNKAWMAGMQPEDIHEFTFDSAIVKERLYSERATVVGRTLEELTFRTIYIARNAALQIQAHALGEVSPLDAEETRLAGIFNLHPGPVARAWEYWSVRLDKAEGRWPLAKRTRKTARRTRKTVKGKRKRQCMIPKTGNRFSEKDHAQAKCWARTMIQSNPIRL